LSDIPDAPEPFLSGTFALYERPDGSVVIAYRTSDGQENRKIIPRMIVRQGLRLARKESTKELGEAAA
jgi:hypothetical protein